MRSLWLRRRPRSSVAMSYVFTCSVEPVAGECPTGSAVWVPASEFSAFPDLTQSEVSDLMAAALVLLVMAWGLRFIRKQIANQ